MFGQVKSSILPILLASVVLMPWGAALAHGALDARIASLSERIAEHPDDKHLYAMRAELYSEHGQLRKAQEDLARVRRIDPAWSEVDLVLARCLMRDGKLTQALDSITAFRKREPDNLEGLRAEAEITFGLKRWRAAEDLYTRYLSEATRPEPDHYLSAAEAIVQQGKAHLGRALSLLDQGIVKLGDVPVLRERAIRIAIQADDYADALQRVQTALSAAHHAERWLALRGDILSKQGQVEQARDAYLASMEAISQRSEARQHSPAMVELRQAVEASLARLTRDGSQLTVSNSIPSSRN